MFENNGKVSVRQVRRLVWIDILGPALLLIPGTLAGWTGTYGVASIVAGTLLGLLYLRVVFWILAKSHNIHLKAITYGFLQLLLFMISFGSFVLLVYVLADLMHKNLTELPRVVLVIGILLIAGYGSTAKAEARARLFEFLFPWLWIPFFIMLCLSAKDIRVGYYWMEDSPGIVNIMKGTLLVLVFYLPLGYLALLKRELIEPVKQYERGLRAVVISSGVILLGVYMILLGCFGRGGILHIDYPIITLMSTIKLDGLFFQRLDAWMLFICFFSFYSMLLLTLRMSATCLRKGGLAAILAGVLLLLGGCNSVELEGKCFPMLMAVDVAPEDRVAFMYTFSKANDDRYGAGKNFKESRHNFERTLNKKVDANHLKVILLGEAFVDNHARMEEMLELLTEEERYPRNCYVCVTEDTSKVLELSTGEEAGRFLEEYLTLHYEDVVTLGDVLNAHDNGEKQIELPLLDISRQCVVEKDYIKYQFRE